jgi:uncharacterized RmlC-like cupin family protein
LDVDLDQFALEGDSGPWALPNGLVVPVVTRAGDEDVQTSDSGGAIRVSGVSRQNTPAKRLWYGKVSNAPGFRSLSHHHGEAETGGYVLSGKARIYYGTAFADYLDLETGRRPRIWFG